MDEDDEADEGDGDEDEEDVDDDKEKNEDNDPEVFHLATGMIGERLTNWRWINDDLSSMSTMSVLRIMLMRGDEKIGEF